MVSADPVPNPDNSLLQTLGEKLLSGDDAADSVDTVQALSDYQYVGVYFGGHWAPPCRKFTDKLKKDYDEANTDGKNIQVVFCSSDGNEAAFKRNFNKMPWLAVDYNDDTIRNQLS